MLAIRLRRIGKRSHVTYRVVVAESKYTPSGRFLLDLGYYDPHTKKFSVDKEKILDWLNKGAQPSNTLAKLLKGEKLKHPSIVVVQKHKKSKKAVDEAVQQAAKLETKASETKPETTNEVAPEAADSPAEDAGEEVAAEPATKESPKPEDSSDEVTK